MSYENKWEVEGPLIVAKLSKLQSWLYHLMCSEHQRTWLLCGFEWNAVQELQHWDGGRLQRLVIATENISLQNNQMMKANSDVTKGYIKCYIWSCLKTLHDHDNAAFNGKGFILCFQWVLAHQKQPYSCFFWFNSAQKALNSCLSHVTLLHALRPSGPSWPQSQHDKLHLLQQQQIRVR